MITLHEIQDSNKVAQLAADMDANGWQGAPLVKWGDQLITGTHRYTAAKSLGWTDYEIPTIELEDVFDEADLDIFEVCEELGMASLAELDALVAVLPEDIRDRYGIDVH